MQEVRRLTLALLAALGLFGLFAQDVVMMTWNMKWFPSGKADLRISPEFERFKVRKAGEMLSAAATDVGYASGSGIIMMVEEMRDAEVCSNLVGACGIEGLKVAAVSRFRDRGGYPLWQQSAILSNLEVVEGGYMPWQSERHVEMPRGFAFAVLGNGDGLIAAFCVHLKANVNYSGTELETQKNIYKREFAAAQILEKFRELRARYADRLKRVVVAGDFNTNEDDETFVSEATLRSFYGAHFRSCFRGWTQAQRVTHPKSGGFPDCTFDYILYRGFGRGVARKICPGSPISDHNIVGIRLPTEVEQPSAN